MKHAFISFLIPGLLILASCSNKTEKKDHQSSGGILADSQKVSIPKAPTSGAGNSGTTIHVNKSEIVAEFIELHQKIPQGFSIVAKVLEVTEDPAYPSVASVNNTYELFPNFVLGEKKEIVDNQRNKKLMQLKDLKRGDRFKAIIFLDENTHWMIQEIID
jgi:hypothetical protein